jgi:uncharacterized repeat protein (TIGR03803 family)
MKPTLPFFFRKNFNSIRYYLLKLLPQSAFCYRVYAAHLLLGVFILFLTPGIRAQDVLVGLTSEGGKLQGGTAFTMKSDGTGFTVRRAFARSGSEPYGDLIKASDGNFYGMTSGGGFNFGTVFRMTSAGAVTVLHSFNGTSEGSKPYGNLLQGPDGNFYGMTYEGGTSKNGTIFKITPSGIYTVLHHLDYMVDGAHPLSSLIKGTDNNFYGMTSTGGTNVVGTIFRITPTGTYTVLRHMNSTPDGAFPQGSLVLGPDGNFYGMTLSGGTNNYGTIFRITPAGAFSVRRHLNYNTDGGYPNRTNLIVAADGNFYGMTYQGGTFGYGTIFKMTPGGTFTVLKNLDLTPDGGFPKGSLTQHTDGSFYGMMQSGGSIGYGTVFKITSGGTYTVLKNLDVTVTGGNAQGSLVRNSTDGNFYGMTSFGGRGGSGLGTIFKITPTGTLSVLVQFPETGKGISPAASVVQATDGNFYGMTSQGGIADNGTVFKFCTSTFSNIKSFDGATTGSNPQGGLVQAPDGNFYGATQLGGTYGYGTIFKISPGGSLSVLWNLDNTNDGAYPSGSLVRGTDGNLYGTASSGGTNGSGTIFKITPSGSVFTILRHLENATTGGSPYGSLVRGKDNNFYGITYQGGTIGFGTIFKITPTGTLTVIKNMDNTNGGYSYNNSLIQGSDGNFYGMTQGGGATGRGVIFKIAPGGNPYIVLRDFDLTSDGGQPRGDLVQGTDGRLYGMTSEGGMNGGGTIFRISTGGTFNVLRHLNPVTDGSNPLGSLVIQKANPIADAQSIITAVNTSKAITLSGSGGSPLTFNVVGQPQNGTLSGSGANRLYKPDAGFTGNDAFTFRVTWGCQQSSIKTVAITVTGGGASTVRLNTGGQAVSTSIGNFNSDNYFAGATSISKTNLAIANTANDALYQDNRRATATGGSFSYNIPVPNGVYTVKLHFAEVFFTTTGKRKFNVTAEGSNWLTNYDIFAAAGGMRRAIVATKNITVSGNTLNLNFVSTLDKACVSAIEVLPVAGAERLAQKVQTEAENIIILGLFPNPVHHQFTVQLSVPLDNPQTSVRDAAGAEVLHNPHQVISPDQLQVNVEALKPGLYLLQVQSNQGYQTMKFLKE